MHVSLPGKICKPNINTSQHFHGHAWMLLCVEWETLLSHLPCILPTRQPGNQPSTFLFWPYRRKQTPFSQLIYCHILKISVHFAGDFRLVPSSVSKCKKTVRCRMAKISMLDKLHSGMGYSALSCELNVNKSTLYIKTHIKQACILTSW